ncbi:MAG: hypothetical protein OXN89_00590 [Bryobacterales bacterium]|nr:hypothetical protein [Bryobacterales bacterium]
MPLCAAEVLFAAEELQFLGAHAEQQGRPGQKYLGSAVALVTHLGGYRALKQEPAPGNRVMWEGYYGLTPATMRHMISRQADGCRDQRGTTAVQAQFTATR